MLTIDIRYYDADEEATINATDFAGPAKGLYLNNMTT